MAELEQSKVDEYLNELKDIPEKERFELARKIISINQEGSVAWKDNNKIIHEQSISSETWMKVRIAEREKDSKKYIRLSRPRQNFNMSTRTELAEIFEALQSSANLLNWKQTENTYESNLLGEISALKEADSKRKEQLRELTEKFREVRLQQLDADIPRFKKELKEFKNIFTHAHEEDLQKFLKNNIWLFGAEYLEQQPVFFSQFNIWDSKYDFLLQRYDTFYDIFELKKADVSLFVGKGKESEDSLPSPGRESPISGDLKDAISQMIRYMEDVNIFANSMLRRSGIFILKPKGRILIGRSVTREKEAVKVLNSYLNNIEILTYDDLYVKGQEFVKIIERRRA